MNAYSNVARSETPRRDKQCRDCNSTSLRHFTSGYTCERCGLELIYGRRVEGEGCYNPPRRASALFEGCYDPPRRPFALFEG